MCFLVMCLLLLFLFSVSLCWVKLVHRIRKCSTFFTQQSILAQMGGKFRLLVAVALSAGEHKAGHLLDSCKDADPCLLVAD